MNLREVRAQRIAQLEHGRHRLDTRNPWYWWPLQALVFLILLGTAPVWIIGLVLVGRWLDHGGRPPARAERILAAIADRAATDRERRAA